jgi:hypothetical protein
MAKGKIAPKAFSAFFSYAHADAKADPLLLKWFAKELPAQVTPLITKSLFKVWHDKEGLRTGEIWNDRLMQEIRGADVLIVLMSPRWLDSEFCRKEFTTFEEVETERKVGPYILPILWRDIDPEKHEFNEEETAVLQRLQTRQQKPALAKDVATATKTKRIKLIKEIAEDIAGMVLRLQKVASQPATAPVARPRSRSADLNAHNFEDYQFARNAEVTIKPSDDEQRVFAQIDFHERMYIESASGRVEFGVRRAILEVQNKGPGKLARADYLRGNRGQASYYLAPRAEHDSIAVSINAQDRPSLGELALPPGPGDNYWSLIAVATPEVQPAKVEAAVAVSLSAEGIWLADAATAKLQRRKQSQIEAILRVAAERHGADKKTRRLRYPVKVGGQS